MPIFCHKCNEPILPLMPYGEVREDGKYIQYHLNCSNPGSATQPSTVEPVIAVNIKGRKSKKNTLTSKTIGAKGAGQDAPAITLEGERGGSIAKQADSGQVKQECLVCGGEIPGMTILQEDEHTVYIGTEKERRRMAEEVSEDKFKLLVEINLGRWGKVFHIRNTGGVEIALPQKDAVKLAKSILKEAERITTK